MSVNDRNLGHESTKAAQERGNGEAGSAAGGRPHTHTYKHTYTQIIIIKITSALGPEQVKKMLGFILILQHAKMESQKQVI